MNPISSVVGCIHHGDPKTTTADDVLVHVMNKDLGYAWQDWCKMTESKNDPITGTARDNDDHVSSTDR